MNNAVEKRPRGRPSVYSPDLCLKVKQWATLGATDFEIAQFLGVNVLTLHRWRASFPDFCKAFVVGKEDCDERVKRSLFGRAVGYSFESEKVFQYRGKVIRAKILEHVPPDPGAAMHWLKNRDPERWKDRREVNVEGTITLAAIIRGIVGEDGGENLVESGDKPAIEHDPEALNVESEAVAPHWSQKFEADLDRGDVVDGDVEADEPDRL